MITAFFQELGYLSGVPGLRLQQLRRLPPGATTVLRPATTTDAAVVITVSAAAPADLIRRRTAGTLESAAIQQLGTEGTLWWA